MDGTGSELGSSTFPNLLPGEKVELTAEKAVDLFGIGARWPERPPSEMSYPS